MSKIVSAPIVVPETVRRKAGLRCGEKIEFTVSGRKITIGPQEVSREPFSLKRVSAMVEDAKASPMSKREAAAVDAELARYGAKQGKKLGITERDVTRVIHESRSRRRSS